MGLSYWIYQYHCHFFVHRLEVLDLSVVVFKRLEVLDLPLSFFFGRLEVLDLSLSL